MYFVRVNVGGLIMEARDFERLIRGKNINFLIGSGASTPLYPTLSLPVDIIGNDRCSLEDIIAHPLLSEERRMLLYLYYFLRWIKVMADEEYGNEDTEKKIVKSNYMRFISAISNFLQTEGNERPKRINIFTTNYDLMFEWTLDKYIQDNSLIYFNDGSRGVFSKYIDSKNYNLNITHSGYYDRYTREIPTINLFKMHGSLSWVQQNDKIKVGLAEEIIKEADIAAKDINVTILDIENLLKSSYCSDFESFIDNYNNYDLSKASESLIPLNIRQLEKFYNKYKSIAIINPNKYKFHDTVLEQHYYQMIRSFSYELEKKQSVLIVFGFSFADEHIKSIFERSLSNPELQVFLISYSKESQDDLKNKFKDLATACKCPKNIPICVCGGVKKFEIITKKSIIPIDDELKNNNRAHSSKLRILERILD